MNKTCFFVLFMLAAWHIGCGESPTGPSQSAPSVQSSVMTTSNEATAGADADAGNSALGAPQPAEGAVRMGSAAAVTALPYRFFEPIKGMLMSYTGCSTAWNENYKFSVVWSGKYALGQVACEGSGSHFGVDIPVKINTPIYAVANGTVVAVNSANASHWGGRYIILKHIVYPTTIGPVGSAPAAPITLYSVYCHLNSIPSWLTNGRYATGGSTIVGYSGNTGNVIGAGYHLHFQMDKDLGGQHPYATLASTINPHPFMRQHMFDTVR